MPNQAFISDNDLGYAQLSVGSTPIYAKAATYGGAALSGIPTGTNILRVYAEGQAIRWRADGVAPTATVGKPLATGSEMVFSEAQFQNLQFVAQTGTATVNLQASGNAPASPPVFSPSSLFASGESGVWFDPSDFSTLFQDASGLIPVTDVGQPVGRINDKSGRGNNAVAASRPILQRDTSGKVYLAFDGVNNSLSTAAPIGFTSAPFECVAGWASGSSGLQALFTNIRYQIISSSTGLRFTTATVQDYMTATGILVAGKPFVMGCLFDASFNANFRKDGVALPQITGSADGALAQNNLQIGAVGGTAFLSGRIYGLMLIKRQLSSAERIAMEGYMNDKTGAY